MPFVLTLCLAIATFAAPAVRFPLWPRNPSSYVRGAAFDRIFQVWLENADYDACADDENMNWIADHGILLTNYYAITHPSQPNYVASVGGDTFGMDNNDDHSIPSNISTVVDLLETRGISWAEYQEDLPYAGFEGSSHDHYVRKHNPLIMYDSVAKNDTRREQIKSLSDFDRELDDNNLPQWAFVTPNMLNDGHDTGLAWGAKWLRNWLEPLLENEEFMDRTLIVVSLDENKTYKKRNRVYTVLLGGAVPRSLHGTQDSMFFNHYSPLSTVSLNWDLPSLGRWDCAANAFTLVANETNYENTNVPLYEGLWWNISYPGPLSDDRTTVEWWPRPITEAECVSGKGTLPSVVDTWGESGGSYNYTSVYSYDNSFEETEGGVAAVGSNDEPVNASEPPPEPSDSEDAGTPSRSVSGLFLAVDIFLAWLLV